MASLSCLPNSLTVASQSSTTKCVVPNNLAHPKRSRLGLRSRQRLCVRAAGDGVSVGSVVDDVNKIPPPWAAGETATLKLKLLAAVSGLNRGLAASDGDLQKADAAAKELEVVGGPMDLSKGLEKLQGRWKGKKWLGVL